MDTPIYEHGKRLFISLECGAELRGLAAQEVLLKNGWERSPCHIHLFEKILSKEDQMVDWFKALGLSSLILVLEPIIPDQLPKGKNDFIAVGRIGSKANLDTLPPCWSSLGRRRLVRLIKGVTWEESCVKCNKPGVTFFKLVAGNPDGQDPNPMLTAKSVIRGIGISI